MLTILLMLLAGVAGWLAGRSLTPDPSDTLSPAQLTDIYRREHQRQLDGRAGWWE